MNLKNKSSLNKSNLYVIVGPDVKGDTQNIARITREALDGGADIIQLRDKINSKSIVLRFANEISKICHEYNRLFIVNDYPDVANECQADGLHIGQDDIGIDEARALLSNDVIIGKSTHSASQASSAIIEGADYIGYGPIYSTPTKPDYTFVGPDTISAIKDLATVPFFVIGGIDNITIHEVLQCGASRVAIVRAVTNAKSPRDAAKYFIQTLASQNVSA